ncbi:MAG: M20/M25/M40 family metallo-hydrolase [bacterium]|nr:M20/M25/M40 family metallo-hydrolase [bacterium]
MIDAPSLLERTLAIPCWRTPDNPDVESGVSAFFSDVIQRELPWLKVNQQHVDGNRFNIFATDGSPMEMLFVGHLDCVPPGTGWEYRVTGEMDGGRCYGRGAYDVKGGIVALLAAAARMGATRGVGYLLYCDEEYDFHGMRRFLAIERSRAKPKLAIAIEPTNLRVRSGCRGITEFTAIVRGKCGHAARPWTGQSALKAFLHGVRRMDEFTEQHTDPTLGRTTRNIASLRAGQFRGLDGEYAILAEDGNIIPDYARGIIEIRTVPSMHAEHCIDAFRRGVEEAGCHVERVVKRFDFRGFQTAHEALKPLTDAVHATLGSVEFEDIGASGYSDVQLLSSQLGVPCAIIGPTGDNMHAADEFVELDSLRQLQEIFERTLVPYRLPAAP